MRALFIYDPADLNALIPGGVQLCSREFLEIVSAAADSVKLFSVCVATDLRHRIRRKLGLGSYLRYDAEAFASALGAEASISSPTHVFLNRAELLRFAPVVTRVMPQAQVVLLSHGNQSGDDLYEVAGPAGKRANGAQRIVATWRLGDDLVTESDFRHRHLHMVCVMTPEEEILERWLGANRTLVLPRVIRQRPIDWQPVSGRVGFVGTLNHTPNLVALEAICRELVATRHVGLQLRIVGGPQDDGERLAAKFPFVNYLGRLDDDALAAEATTWMLFLNPIFWLSRGASMKLGQALSWALPVLSTRAGARGYTLAPDTAILTDDEASQFASQLLLLLKDESRLYQIRANQLASAQTNPSVQALGAVLRTALLR